MKRKARAAPPPKKVKSVAVVEKFVADKLPTLPSAQGYASRKHTSKARVLSIFGAITAFCAGDLDDTPELLIDYLDQPSNSTTKAGVLAAFARDDAYTNLVGRLGEAFSNTERAHEKMTFLQFVCDKPKKLLQSAFGFTGLGAKLLRSVRTAIAAPGYKPSHFPPPKGGGGRPPLAGDAFSKLHDLYWENSVPAADCSSHEKDADGPMRRNEVLPTETRRS